MATPTPVSASAPLNTATFGRFAHTGSKTGVKVIFARIRYTGSAWEVHATTDSNEIVSANCVWSTNKLTVAISGFTIAPSVVATQNPGATTPYLIQAGATSASNIDIEFWDLASVQVTTQANSMDFQIHVEGS